MDLVKNKLQPLVSNIGILQKDMSSGRCYTQPRKAQRFDRQIAIVYIDTD